MGKIKEHIYQNGPWALSSSPTVKNCTSDTAGKRVHYGRTDPKALDRRHFLALYRKALANGAEKRGSTMYWNMTANAKRPCASPRYVGWVSGHRAPQAWDVRPSKEDTIGFIEFYGRCRKCEPCRLFRRAQWISRAIVEADATKGRIWFVTLSSNPVHRTYIDQLAAIQAVRDGDIFDHLTPEQVFGLRARIFRKEISSYLKRVRKGVGKLHKPRIRFLAVTEPHKDNHCHGHLLVYEQDVGQPVSERLLRSRWQPRGFAQAVLVSSEGGSIRYVSKYLAKDFSGTVHASVRYGQPQANDAL